MSKVSVIFHHTEDDAATICGPNGALVVAYNGSDYSIMKPPTISGQDYTVCHDVADYGHAIELAKQKVA